MEERCAIKLYHDKGFSEKEIIEKLMDLDISRCKVYRTVKRLRETGSIADRPRSGRPRSSRTPELVNKVKCRLWRNRQQSIRMMAKKLNTSRTTLQRVVKKDLGLKPYKKRKVQGLTQQQLVKRMKRSQMLLKRFANQEIDHIVFSDEKLFGVEERVNSQNVRIYSASFEDIPEHMRTVQRFQYEDKTMVWAGCSKNGKFPLVFVDPGTKINAAYYKSHILVNVVKPQGQQMYNEDNWCFQQDSAPAHKAKICQKWCEKNLPDFISTEDWPPSSPDLNPLDYSIWGILETRVNSTRHTSLESLKAKIEKEWNDLSMDTLRTAIDSWPKRLKAVRRARGGRFE